MDNEALEHRVADLERRLREMEARPIQWPTPWQGGASPENPFGPSNPFNPLCPFNPLPCRVTLAVPDGPPSY